MDRSKREAEIIDGQLPYSITNTQLNILNNNDSTELEESAESLLKIQLCMLTSTFAFSVAFLVTFHLIAIFFAFTFIYSWHRKSNK